MKLNISLNSHLSWVLGTKAVSAACILLQAATFAYFLPPEETQLSYFILAFVSLIGQAAMAVPNLLVSQGSWLQAAERSQTFRAAFLLMLVLCLIFSTGLFAFPTPLLNVTVGWIIFGIAIFAALPNLFATDHFSIGNVRIGAGFAAINVVLPQVLAAAAAAIFNTAIAWCSGLLAGHIIALSTIMLVNRVTRHNSRPQGERERIRLSGAVIASTYVWLLFVWSIPNLPRIVLADDTDATFVSQLLIAASISFACSNAIETAISQLRRSKWLSRFELAGRQDASQAIRGDLKLIIFAAALAIVPFWLLVYLASLVLFGPSELQLGIWLVLLIAATDMLRVSISLVYLVAEAGRSQSRLAPIIAGTTILCGAAFFGMDSSTVIYSYSTVAAVLLVCAAAAVARAIRATASRRTSHESD